LNRKLREYSDNGDEQTVESINPEKQDTMTDDVKELIRLNNELGQLKIEIALANKEKEDTEYLKRQVENLRGLLQAKDEALRAKQQDQARTMEDCRGLRARNSEVRNELQELQERFVELQKEYEEMQEERDEIQEAYEIGGDDLTNENLLLKKENSMLIQDKTDLVFACLILQHPKGFPVSEVHKFLGTERFKEEENWSFSIWNSWKFEHAAGAKNVLSKNLK
jgi:chromosome segregation ATPase